MRRHRRRWPATPAVARARLTQRAQRGVRLDVRIGALSRPIPGRGRAGREAQRNTVWLDGEVLSAQRWGQVDLASAGRIDLDGTLRLQEAAGLGSPQAASASVERCRLPAGRWKPEICLRRWRAHGIADVRTWCGGCAAGARIDLGGGWGNACRAGRSRTGVDRRRAGALQQQPRYRRGPGSSDSG